MLDRPVQIHVSIRAVDIRHRRCRHEAQLTADRGLAGEERLVAPVLELVDIIMFVAGPDAVVPCVEIDADVRGAPGGFEYIVCGAGAVGSEDVLLRKSPHAIKCSGVIDALNHAFRGENSGLDADLVRTIGQTHAPERDHQDEELGKAEASRGGKQHAHAGYGAQGCPHGIPVLAEYLTIVGAVGHADGHDAQQKQAANDGQTAIEVANHGRQNFRLRCAGHRVFPGDQMIDDGPENGPQQADRCLFPNAVLQTLTGIQWHLHDSLPAQ